MYNNYSDCTYDNFMIQHGIRAKDHYVVVASEINNNEEVTCFYFTACSVRLHASIFDLESSILTGC